MHDETAAAAEHVTRIRPDAGWPLLDLAELWRTRELLLILTQRDLKVRYRQAVVGAAWAVLQPATSLAIFAVIFGLLGRTPTQPGIPYLLSALCGLLPWQLFATGLTSASGSLVNNRNMLTKIYFPRLYLPLASVLCAAVDFIVACGLLVLLLIWYRFLPSLAVLLLPLLMLWTLLMTTAAGMVLSASNALYRDVGYIVPFLIQVGFFVSPVVYDTQTLIPERWRAVYAINPLVGLIETFRWSALGGSAPRAETIAMSLASTAVLCGLALVVFRRTERKLADRI